MPTFSLSDARLGDATIDISGVLSDITAAFRQIDPTSWRMREFMETISAETYPQPTPFPMPNNKGDWADYGTDLDTLWKTLVANEPKLAPGEEVEGFDPDQKLLVKPWETAHAPVAVLTTCSPAMTLHEHYGSVRDVSNEGTARLLLKLGHSFPGMQSKALFMAHLPISSTDPQIKVREHE
jgi:hypothetical protein